MDKGKINKFFKAYVRGQTYKVFLDDLSSIYKVSHKKTPPLTPYSESTFSPKDQEDFKMEKSNPNPFIASETFS